MAKASQKLVRQWCLGVGARMNVSGTPDEFNIQLQLTVPALCDRFPAEAFCAASLNHAAASERYWNEARITASLSEWVRDNLYPKRVSEPLPAWLLARIMQECGNRPGPRLTAWLEAKGVMVDEPVSVFG